MTSSNFSDQNQYVRRGDFASDSTSQTEEKDQKCADLKKVEKPPIAVRTIQSIEKGGTRLGVGSFGVVYRIDDWVYKIYHKGQYYFKDVTENEVTRAIKYWNQTYENIYDGKYRHYAVAFYIKVQGFYIGITPFIDGENLDVSCGSFCCPHSSSMRSVDQNTLDNELKKIGLGMSDLWIRANVKKTKDGHLLPIDFDAFFTRPIEIDTFTACFDTDNPPPSPLSRHWANHNRFFTVDDKSRVEIERLKEQHASREKADLFGGRSMYFRSF